MGWTREDINIATSKIENLVKDGYPFMAQVVANTAKRVGVPEAEIKEAFSRAEGKNYNANLNVEHSQVIIS